MLKKYKEGLYIFALFLFFLINPVYGDYYAEKCINTVSLEVKESFNGKCDLGGFYYDKWFPITLYKREARALMGLNLDYTELESLIAIQALECKEYDGFCKGRNSKKQVIDIGPYQINFATHYLEANKSEFFIFLAEATRAGYGDKLRQYYLKTRRLNGYSFSRACERDIEKCFDYYGIQKGLSFEDYRLGLFEYQSYWTLNRMKRIENKYKCSEDTFGEIKCQLWYHNGNMKKVGNSTIANQYAYRGIKMLKDLNIIYGKFSEPDWF